MGRLLLVCRLAARDLRRRPAEAVMLLVAFTAATTVLTLGLVLHGVTVQPYHATRAATAGPDVLATYFPGGSGPAADPPGLAALAPVGRAPGIAARSGPFPVAFPVLRARGISDAVLAEGRGIGPVPVDQPKLTAGSWVRPGQLVLERSFADALGVGPGDRVTLDGRPFGVAGIAVTAAFPADGVGFLEGSARWPNPGLVWLTEADARSLATGAYPLGYVLNLKLARPGAAEAFADRFDPGGYTNNSGGRYLIPWQDISRQDGLLVRGEQQVLLTASWLLILLAAAGLVILVGGRMADQVRRVGLLKAVGGTPALVASVLLAEYLAVALAAAVAGLAAGWLAAPLLTSPGAGLLGASGPPQLTVAGAAAVTAAALGMAVLATFVPAVRAARVSTVGALADAPRPPRRRAWLVARSARLPAPLLVGIRLAARRPRRMALSAAGLAVTVSGIVAVLFAHAVAAVAQFGGPAGTGDPGLLDVGFDGRAGREGQVLLVVAVMLVALATVNAVFITLATVRDSRHASAVARALGVTSRQLTWGLSAAQALPALAGALVGIPGGFALFTAASQGGSTAQPPTWWLAAVVPGTMLAVAALTAVPARAGARQPVTSILQAEAR